jgi:hypothetical protein
MQLKPWREVAEPHTDVASGRYAQAGQQPAHEKLEGIFSSAFQARDKLLTRAASTPPAAGRRQAHTPTASTARATTAWVWSPTSAAPPADGHRAAPCLTGPAPHDEVGFLRLPV